MTEMTIEPQSTEKPEADGPSKTNAPLVSKLKKIYTSIQTILQHVCQSDAFTDDDIGELVNQDYQFNQALRDLNLDLAKQLLNQRLLIINAMRSKKCAKLDYTQRTQCLLLQNLLDDI